jgi:hypothetical protein
MLVVRMHQMGIAKMVQPICIGGRESAVYLEYGDAEDEYERKDVEKYSQFDDKAVFEKKSGDEYRYSVFEDQKSENLGNRLFAAADEQKTRAHRRQRNGNGELRRARGVNMEKTPDGESADRDKKDYQLGNVKRNYRLKFAAGAGFTDGVHQKHWKRNAFYKRIYESDYPHARARTAFIRPVPHKNRQYAHDHALHGDKANGGL